MIVTMYVYVSVYGLACLVTFTYSTYTFAIESISRSRDGAKGGLELPWSLPGPRPPKKNG